MTRKVFTPAGLLVVMASVLSLMQQVRAEETSPVTLELVRDGKPAATIVVAEKPTRAAQFAAAELQYHVHKITGATLPIRSDEETTEGTRILIGESKAALALGLRNDDFKRQEYLIRFQPHALILMGRDKEDRGKMDYNDPKTFPGAFGGTDAFGRTYLHNYDYAEQATCYAVYDFLERYCDVRWYLPTELGLVCPSTKTLQVTGTEVRRAPAWRCRYTGLGAEIPADFIGAVFEEEPPVPNLSWRERVIFMARLRFGGEPFQSGHTLGVYNGFWNNPENEMFKNFHPEYFAQGYEHLRVPPGEWQLCFTNPGLIQQVAQDATDYFDGKRDVANNTGDSFFLGARDNGNWCKCLRCQALMKKHSTRDSEFYFNDRITDCWYTFVNAVAREVKKTHPDKWIGTWDYSAYAYPPERVKVEPNVWVQIVLDARNVWCRETQRIDRERLEAWAAESKERPKILYLWYCFPALSGLNNFHCFPGFFAHSLVRQMKEYERLGIKGFHCQFSASAYGQCSLLMDQVECYLTFKLADDPTLDEEKLIDEFFDRYYGAAAKPMQAFYETVEKIYSDPANYPPGVYEQTEEIAWKYLGTEERMEKLGRLMGEAKTAARTEVEKERVALFEKGIWQRMQEGRKTYVKHAELKAKASALQEGRAPRLDAASPEGDPRKVDWSKGDILSNWRSLSLGEETERKLEGRILHDGVYLYLRLQEHLETKGLLRTGDTVWDEDEWEIFVAGSRGKPYRQMGVNANGVHIDLAYGEEGEEWESGAIVYSDTESTDCWTVYIAFPLAKLLPGGVYPGQTIYLNIIRSKGIGNRVRNALAWNPTFAGYHEPSRFGQIVLEK